MLCHRKLGCTPAALGAAVAIAHRCCQSAAWRDEACQAWLQLLSRCPALLPATETHAPVVREVLRRDTTMAARMLAYLSQKKVWDDFMNERDGSWVQMFSSITGDQVLEERLATFGPNELLFAVGNLSDILLPAVRSVSV